MSPRTAIWLVIAIDLILWLAIVTGFCSLFGCGGGGDEADEQQTNILVDCNLHPEICK